MAGNGDKPLIDAELYQPEGDNAVSCAARLQLLMKASAMNPEFKTSLVSLGDPRAWARRWNLTIDGDAAAWAVRLAHRSLDCWTQDPRITTWLVGSWASYVFQENIQFSAQTYEPREETREAARRRILDAVARELDRQIENVEKELSNGGSIEVPIKRVPLAHLEWFVKFQLQGEPINSFAKGSESAIRQACRSIAALLPLSLRRERLGRPPK